MHLYNFNQLPRMRHPNGTQPDFENSWNCMSWIEKHSWQHNSHSPGWAFPRVFFMESWTPRKLTRITRKGFCYPIVLENEGFNSDRFLPEVLRSFDMEVSKNRRPISSAWRLVEAPPPRFVFQVRPDCWKMEHVFSMYQAAPTSQASVTICFI